MKHELKIPKNRIETTKDYDAFERLPGNRPIDENHVVELMEAMKKKDLFVPIQINQNLEIIDGQHRLEARKRLGLDVPYYVTEDYDLADVQAMNSTSKRWSVDDFCRSYIERGKKDYEIYRWFRQRYKLSHQIAGGLLTGKYSGALHGNINHGGVNANLKTVFESGNFKVTHLEEAKAIAEDLVLIQPYFDHWNSRGFIAALLFCRNKAAFEFKKFLSKLENNPLALKPCATTDLYIQHLEEIYNYRSATKVSLRYGEDKK